MAVSLKKGGNVSLTKEAPTMKRLTLGLGWDPRKTDGQKFDLDAMVFLLGANGQVRSDADFIFFNNTQSTDGSVVHAGDNRSGEGEGDDETIEINLEKVPSDVDKIVASVVIYEGQANNQNFGMVDKAYIRVVNADGGTEVARYDLTEDGGTVTAMIFGELYRHNGEWKFKARGEGYDAGFQALVKSYGVNV
ncbi:TerD family protein [Deinococcus peraridilitoris]|uniref:Putative stress response protein, TerZ-and CABP1 n=1 Tax=Deinococcus peraridilitoris (strain DSM 19664 / LMG 22246 / CIP 109416 / KR-200) TaxID=937777 RepID=L0A173_DEIPD|nr:TerD family protein [Deinococcus peraridilitoris]AFZ66937.1 putative stress response protein, TerZ- and CABP1 [Deinococcus peraridilitoris DSM 19664]